jgi:hypothetical protein
LTLSILGIFEKTCTFVPKTSLTSSFTTKVVNSLTGEISGFETENLNIPVALQSSPKTEPKENYKNKQVASEGPDSELTSTVLKEIGVLKLQHSEMMSEMRKGFGKLSKPHDNFLANIKKSLLCNSPDAFDALDNELTYDPEFYLTVTITGQFCQKLLLTKFWFNIILKVLKARVRLKGTLLWICCSVRKLLFYLFCSFQRCSSI